MPIEKEFYTPIYRILMSKISEEDKQVRVANWLICNHKSIKLSTLRNSFRKAERADLIDQYIEDLDVKIGDKVKSRSTSRKGKVTEIKSDGETLVVKWDTGGTQTLSKDMIMLIHNDKDNTFERSDFSNAKTEMPGYNKHTKKDTDIDTNREIKVIDFDDL